MEKESDPRMHSAEHILNQTMDRAFHKGRCFSAHIEKKKSKCDYHFDRDLTPEEASSIEAKVNEVIKADMPVTEEFITKDEAAKKYNLTRLPEDAGQELRIVKIGDYDACPCIGKHVAHSGEIGSFHIISHDWAEGVLRLRYKLGE